MGTELGTTGLKHDGELAFYGYDGVISPWLPGLDGSTLKSSWDFRIFRDFSIFSLRTTIRYYLPGPQLRLQHDGCTTLQLLFPWQFFSCICSIDDTSQNRHPQHPTHVDRPWQKHSLRPLSFLYANSCLSWPCSGSPGSLPGCLLGTLGDSEAVLAAALAYFASRCIYLST